MAAAGVYGVTSYMTSRRTQEIGIRMALGASTRNVHTLLFRQCFVSVCVGLAIGFVLTLILMPALRGIIAGLQTVNVTDMWVAGSVVSLSAAAACWIPARRATRVDPMSALRQE
jgi:putative ABC transport system permease protein